LRAPRNQAETPRRLHTCQDTPVSEQISIPVPAIVSAELFAAVQEQLEENRRRSREQTKGAKYLLQGLLVCDCCGAAFCGKHAQKGGRYPYYRCLGTDAYRFGGQRMCHNKQIPTVALEVAVWNNVQEVLRDPEMVRQEYTRRMDESASDDTSASEQLARQITSSRRAMSRLLDAYTAELVSKEEFEPRMRREKMRLARLESQATETARRQSQRGQLKHVIGQLNDFVEKLRDGLAHADWTTRREIIRTLVKAVTIGADDVKITYRISPSPCSDGPARGPNRQHCRRFERLAGG
jgi:site-specific DNA recombinase